MGKMKNVQELYKEKLKTPQEALSLIQDGDYIFLAQAAGEAYALLSELQYLKKTGIKNTTLNTCLPIHDYDVFHDPEMAGVMDHNDWFFNKSLRKARDAKLVSPVPQSSTSILRKTLQRLEVEKRRPVVIATVAPTEVDATIGKYVASLVEDGSTIQLGIGNIPNAVANELKSKKHLGIHTEMFTETMIDLIECGAVDNSQKGLLDGYSVCSFTLGSQRLYNYLDDNPSVLFKSCTFTNDPYTIGKNNKFVSINATLELDLTGQCASETVGTTHFSGTGGQSETVMGSQMSKGGKSIIAMHSTYTAVEGGKEVLHSKIVPTLTPGAAVTTSRNDVDYVVTEYGIAWLRGLNVKRRVEELTKIAHPDFRDELRAKAEELKIW